MLEQKNAPESRQKPDEPYFLLKDHRGRDHWFMKNKQAEGEFYMASRDTDFVSLPLLTVSETAKYLGVGRKIVYQLLEFGEIRAVKRKGAVLIEKASIDSFRSSGKLT
ncbi:MAG: helix-turn-helix domain-containing protein [Desulfobacterales bacterium]